MIFMASIETEPGKSLETRQSGALTDDLQFRLPAPNRNVDGALTLAYLYVFLKNLYSK